MNQYEEPKKCDKISQMTLSALHKRGRASTGELREMTGVKSRSIRHRIDEYLSPAELVREVERRDHAGNDERVFELTTGGQQYVADQWADLIHYAQRHEVLDAAKETHNRLDLLHDRLDDIDRRVNRIDGDQTTHEQRLNNRVDTMETSLGGEMGQLRNRVEEAEEHLGTVDKRLENIEERLNEMESDISDHENRLTSVEKIAEEAWAWCRKFELGWDKENRSLGVSRYAKTLVTNYSPLADERDWKR